MIPLTILETSLRFRSEFGIFLFLISLCEQVLKTHQKHNIFWCVFVVFCIRKPPDFLNEGAICCSVSVWLSPSGQSIRKRLEQTLYTILLFAHHWCVTVKRTCNRFIFFYSFNRRNKYLFNSFSYPLLYWK